MNLLTTTEVAARLKVSVRWVQALIASGRLPSERKGRDYFVKESDLKTVSNLKPGPKPKGTDAKQKKKPRTKA
jgi:excisionase family DNA binding protein